ncbi:probable flavin-containing monoamine oxidase A [Strongylocentrotus purpuratus]|uniref:Amine oxidase n=1 Tax=Strongylocentrotus purpuratus TaxID=7668 RepID=A0A7M7GEI3_STRPU|nr:probable flavin-containing monoamine oxidase A [Strongylocentrotus purpuratus]
MSQPISASDGEYDVIVIGAGLSGLTAAYQLRNTIPGCKVIVLEAKDRIGGRTLTVPLKCAGGTDYWDLGGQWVCRTQHHILWLLKELGMGQYPQFTDGTKLQQSGNSAKPMIRTYESEIPSLPLHVLLDLLNFERKADSLARDIPCDAPWRAKNADDYDSITFEQFLARETWTQGAKDVVEGGFEVVNGSRGRGHSALNYLFYISSGISNKSLYDNKNAGAQESKIKGGAQPLSIKLQERLGQSNVLLSEPVVSIDQSSRSEVKVRTLSGKSFTCKYVINSIPMNCSVSIQYLPEPPSKRHMFIGHTKVGNLLKFIATYKTAFWRDKGYSGEIFNMSTNDGSNYRGPLLYVADATSPNDSPALVGFINNPLYWGNVEDCKRKNAILQHLATFLGSEALTPIDFMEKHWAKEPYNGGCPTNMMMTGAAEYWDEIRVPFHRVHWAGTETATHWMGYLSGAVQSGLRAADEIVNMLTTSEESKGNSSDLLQSLDNLGDVDRRSEVSWTSWGVSGLWTLGKIGLGLVAAGLVTAGVQALLQAD